MKPGQAGVGGTVNGDGRYVQCRRQMDQTGVHADCRDGVVKAVLQLVRG